MTAFSGALGDGLVIAWRTLKRVPRIPELAIFAILQSIMFVVLFAFVFGGAIPLPGGGSYREYLMPGIYIQTLAFASITTAIAFADDMTKGIIDRFRSLPMARSGVLSGRTFADEALTSDVARLVAAFSLEGAINVQGFVGPDGRAQFTEVNPRFSGGLPLSLASGADLVGEYVHRLEGGELRLERLAPRAGVTMARYFAEVYP